MSLLEITTWEGSVAISYFPTDGGWGRIFGGMNIYLLFLMQILSIQI